MRKDGLRASLAKEHRAETGGWWCYACQAWTELDSDREQRACLMCGRPTVKLLPPARSERPTPRQPVAADRARQLFSVLKQSLDPQPTTERNSHEPRPPH